MNVFLYILAFIFLLIILILISPLRLTIDTISNTYSVRWKGIIQVKLVTENQEPVINLQMLAFTKNINLLHTINKKKVEKKVEKKDNKYKSKKSKKVSFQKMKQLLRTFTIKTFYVNLDFDNYILNSYLFPIFFFLKSQNRSLHINYTGNNEIQLILENRPYKILSAYLFSEK